MPKVKVYDSKNNDRLLGTVFVSGPAQGRSYAMAAVMPLDCYRPINSIVHDIQSVRFNIAMRTQMDKGGWKGTVEGVLETDAPLDMLMRLREFSLPGESDRQADERRYISTYLK